MSEEVHGIGAELKAAREAKGWTTQEVGSRLRLMSRQIEAIEAEDFARLGQPVFARGFVRNYARLLGLDPDKLLEQMTRIKTAPVQNTESVPFTPSQEFWKSPWVLGGIALVVLLVAIPVGLYLWLTSDEEEQSAPVAEQSAPPPAPPPAPVLDAQSAAPTAADAAAGAASAPAATVAPPPAQPAPAQPAVARVPQAPVPAAPTGVPAVPVARPPLPFPVPPPAAPQPAAPEQQPAPATGASLRMQFDESAWVQVRDSTGRMLVSGLNPSGTTVEVNGKAPFYLVVGNAVHVRVVYKGQPVDLAPFTSVNVARLTLNQ